MCALCGVLRNEHWADVGSGRRARVIRTALLERVLGEYEIDSVLHLAAQTIVPIANRNPVGTWETNVGGTWALLDDVEDLVVPDDLAAAFARHPGSRDSWDGFSRSAKRSILEWIVTAKRPETRSKRIAETAEKASRGERAHQ